MKFFIFCTSLGSPLASKQANVKDDRSRHDKEKTDDISDGKIGMVSPSLTA